MMSVGREEGFIKTKERGQMIEGEREREKKR